MPSFIYKNNIIEYTLSRNAKKNVNFRIKSDGNVYVSAPRRVSKKELEQMLYDKAEWIIKNREKIMQKQHNKIDKEIKNGNLMILNGNKYIVKIIPGKINKIYLHENLLTIQIKEKYYKNNEYVNKYFDKWIRETICYFSNQFAEKYIKKLSKYNLIKPEIIIRDMKSRWGSCIPSKNKILISKNIFKLFIKI